MQRKSMTKIVHKSYLKKMLLIALLVMCGFVYAQAQQAKVVKFYPNPAVSVINFEFAKNIDKTYTLQIYTFTGKKMTDVSVSANKLSVTLNNDFYRGIYIYQLHDRTGKIVESGKFQIVR
jgi:hypothetical protein